MIELGELGSFSGQTTWARDLIPADGDLANIQDCRLATNTPPSIYALYDGDLWEPGRDVQLSGWTRPSITGYSTAEQAPSLSTSFRVIDNIRYVSGSNTIVFDYYTNPFTLPYVSIREDSWMGPETNNKTFQGEVRVKNGVTLTFDGGDTGTVIDFQEGIFVETGGAVRIGDNVTLRFGPGERLIVNGTLDSFGDADGVTLAPSPRRRAGPSARRVTTPGAACTTGPAARVRSATRPLPTWSARRGPPSMCGTAGLAPGVYLVQAIVKTQAATEQFTRTLTVVR